MLRFFLYFFILITLPCSAHYQDYYVDEQGNEIQFDPILIFTSQYNLCNCSSRDIKFKEAHKIPEAHEILREAIEPLYYSFEPPFTRGITPRYSWDSSGDYSFRFARFWSAYFRRNPLTDSGGPNKKIELYSEYAERFNYLYYWFTIASSAEIKFLKESIDDLEECIRKAKYYGIGYEHTEKDLEAKKRELNEVPALYAASAQMLSSGFERITNSLYRHYCYCLAKHKDPISLYQRGRIAMDRGQTFDFVDDIFSLIELGYALTPEMDLELAKAYSDANLYHQAVKTLSEALKKNPQLKEAYFERAVAYFEMGNLQLALSDYLNYGTRPTILKDPSYQQFIFSLGLGLGCTKGGVDSVIEFVPSLFSSIYGVGKGLWTFAVNPIGISKELVESTLTAVAFLKDHLTPELLAVIVPELKECIEKWDQLEEKTKGYYIGYVIGRYGVDALICGGGARAIQLYRNVKRANAILTLETAIVSPANTASLAKASEEYFIWRSDFKKKCKLHRGQQEKHIPGANNFQTGKGELTISIEHLEQIVTTKLGEGVPSRFAFGEAGYKELVEFDEIIGIHVDFDTNKRIPTSIGEIHYDKNGGYHVVPVEPNKLKRILNQRKRYDE